MLLSQLYNYLKERPDRKPNHGPLRGRGRIEYEEKALLLWKPGLRRGRKPRLP
jgi:hypothetical protein